MDEGSPEINGVDKIAGSPPPVVAPVQEINWEEKQTIALEELMDSSPESGKKTPEEPSSDLLSGAGGEMDQGNTSSDDDKQGETRDDVRSPESPYEDVRSPESDKSPYSGEEESPMSLSETPVDISQVGGQV